MIIKSKTDLITQSGWIIQAQVEACFKEKVSGGNLKIDSDGPTLTNTAQSPFKIRAFLIPVRCENIMGRFRTPFWRCVEAEGGSSCGLIRLSEILKIYSEFDWRRVQAEIKKKEHGLVSWHMLKSWLVFFGGQFHAEVLWVVWAKGAAAVEVQQH